MAHTVQNLSAGVEQKDVSVPTHQFNNEPKLHGVHEFVFAVQMQFGNTVHADLPD